MVHKEESSIYEVMCWLSRRARPRAMSLAIERETVRTTEWEEELDGEANKDGDFELALPLDGEGTGDFELGPPADEDWAGEGELPPLDLEGTGDWEPPLLLLDLEGIEEGEPPLDGEATGDGELFPLLEGEGNGDLELEPPADEDGTGEGEPPPLVEQGATTVVPAFLTQSKVMGWRGLKGATTSKSVTCECVRHTKKGTHKHEVVVVLIWYLNASEGLSHKVDARVFVRREDITTRGERDVSAISDEHTWEWDEGSFREETQPYSYPEEEMEKRPYFWRALATTWPPTSRTETLKLDLSLKRIP